MGYRFEVSGECRFSTEHAAQDDAFVHVFEHEGKQISVGVLSDGCTESGEFHYQPELGAHWLVRAFAEQAEAVYLQGMRGESLGRTIALNVLAGMANYKPQYSRSRWRQGTYGRYCDELVATLYGFVADEENLVLITSGDGFVLENSIWEFNPYSGTYPCHIVAHHPARNWPDALDTYFRIRLYPTDMISAFAIASDGFKDVPEATVKKAVQQWGNHPERLVRELVALPEIPEEHDDITVVALAVL